MITGISGNSTIPVTSFMSPPQATMTKGGMCAHPSGAGWKATKFRGRALSSSRPSVQGDAGMVQADQREVSRITDLPLPGR